MGIRGPRLWGLLFLLWTLLGLLNASTVVSSNLAEGRDGDVAFALLMEMTGAYTNLMLLPVMVAAFRRFPVTRATWWHRVPALQGVSLVVGASHTLLMWGTRTVAYQILDWGTYDYGVMRYRFLMEYQKQFLAFWLIFFGYQVLVYLRRGREREVQAAALQTQLSEARLNVLKMQLNPHFLFNTLNMISSFAHSDPDRADAMISNLSDFLREALRQSGVQEVTLGAELELLRSYLDIMKARFDDRLSLDVDVDQDIREALVPHLILQPLVENAVTHGTARQVDPGRIRIAGRRQQDRLVLTIDDNGPGVSGQDDGGPGHGVGLANVSERLRTLYGDGQGLTLTNRPEGGARVTIDLPWHTEPGS